jgi:predicted ATPase
MYLAAGELHRGVPSALLKALVEHSLVMRLDQHDERPRFRLLETVRAYALEQLEAHGEVDVARCGHARYYFSQAVPDDAAALAVDSWLNRVADDHANLRAASRWLSQFAHVRPPVYPRRLTLATHTQDL